MRRAFDIAVIILTMIVVVVALSGYLPEQAMLLSYVRSDSMKPTMNVGDVFFIIPRFLAGEVNVGDVIVFRFPNEQGYFVHRVVGRTEQGYVTKGDNSPFADQQGSRPYVTEEMVVGKVASLFGNYLLIPKLGIFLFYLGFYVKANLLLFAVVTLALGVLSIFMDKPKHKLGKRRRLPKIKHIYFFAALVLMSTASISMVFKSNVLQIKYLSSKYAIEGDVNAVQPGINISRTIFVENMGLLPTYVVIRPESSRVYVNESGLIVWPMSSEEVLVKVKTNLTTGWHTEKVAVGTYLLVLPPAVIEWLSEINIYLPIFAITLFLASSAAIVYKILEVGNQKIISRRNRYQLLKIEFKRMILKILNI